MDDFNELVKKLQQLKPDLTSIEIGKRIEQKKQKVGAEYLTDEGALFLIASDLGVSSSSLSKKDSTKNKPHQQETPSNKSQINQDFERKFKSIESMKNKSSLHNKSAGILIIFALAWIIIVSVLQLDFISLEFQIIGLIIAPIGIAIGLLKRAGKFSLKINQDYFFTIYRVIVDLQTFHDLNTEQSKKNAITSVFELTHLFGFPHQFGYVIFDDTPSKIYFGIRYRIVPLIKKRDLANIEKFNSILHDLIYSIESKGISKEPFIQFSNNIEQFPKIEEEDHDKPPSFFQKRPQFKYVWIAPVVGSVLFYIFYNIDTSQLHASLGYSLTISTGLLIAILTLVKRKSFESEKS